MKWLWWILGLGAVGGVVYVISSSTGKPVAAAAACISDLPEPFKSSARAAIKAGDVAAMTRLAAQADGSKWTCASKELHDAMLRAKSATVGIDDVTEPQRSEWKKLLDRALNEADPGGDLIASLETAAADAANRGYMKVRDLLRDASRDVRRSIRLVRITEEPPAKEIQAAVAAATSPSYAPTKATVDALSSLATRLDALGYADAAGEARNMVEIAKKKSSAVVISYSGPASYTAPTAPVDPFAALPDDVRARVQAAYDSGDPQQLDDEADADLVSVVSYHPAWLKVKADAAAMRASAIVRLVDMPWGKGTVIAAVSEETGADWMSSPIDYWAKMRPWSQGKLVADALWKRGYKQAANDVSHLWWTIDLPEYRLT